MQLGFARADITPTTRGMGMMGWAMIDNVALTVATPLSARAMVIRGQGKPIAMCVAELAFISRSVRDGVLARLGAAGIDLDSDRLLLMATHTHSGPGGYSEAPLYNATIPGHQPEVLERIVAGITQAITQAWAQTAPASLAYAEQAFAPEVEVAFNREPADYCTNPDVTPTEDPRLALDRTMRALVGKDAGGRLMGLMSFFAVHGTNVHSDNTALHFDNKGYAARHVEERHQGAVCGFAQGATGDVTPNFMTHPGRPWTRGKYPDDDASAQYNGSLQGGLVEELVARGGQALGERVLARTIDVDMTRVEVDADLADGWPRRTGPAEIGMSMFFGTEEGPGLPLELLPVQAALLRARKWLGRRRNDPVQGDKVTWMETTVGKMFGMHRLSRLPPLPLPGRVRRVLEQVRKMEHSAPWTPHVLPVQLLVVGKVAIAAAPGEFTTVAGLRVRKLVQKELASLGIEHVIFVGYANDYAGYVVTPEEYDLQNYEGASTHFGKWTLPAYLTIFRRLARSLTSHT